MKNKSLVQAIKEKIEFSIRFKLSVKLVRMLVTTLLAAGIGVTIVFGVFNLKESVNHNYQQVFTILNRENAFSSNAFALSPGENNYPELKNYAAQNHSPVLIFDRAGNLLWGTEPEWAKFKPKSWFRFIRQDNSFFFIQNQEALVAGTPIELVIFTDISPNLAAIFQFSKIIFIILAVLALPAIISIIQSGKGIFHPIRNMTKTVKHISEENLNLRLNVSGSQDELKELALTFNEMMNRIEDNYNRQKQFVSDASHELRTPIAVIQGYAVMLSRWGKDDPEVLQESISAIKNEAKT